MCRQLWVSFSPKILETLLETTVPFYLIPKSEDDCEKIVKSAVLPIEMGLNLRKFEKEEEEEKKNH